MSRGLRRLSIVGFTLIEGVICISLMGILATVFVSSAIVVTLTSLVPGGGRSCRRGGERPGTRHVVATGRRLGSARVVPHRLTAAQTGCFVAGQWTEPAQDGVERDDHVHRQTTPPATATFHFPPRPMAGRSCASTARPVGPAASSR